GSLKLIPERNKGNVCESISRLSLVLLPELSSFATLRIPSSATQTGLVHRLSPQSSYPGYRLRHALGDIGVLHMVAVPGKTKIALAVYDDQATGARGSCSEQDDGRLCGLSSGLSTGDEIGGAFGDEQAHEVFAVARAGDGGMIVGVET